MRVHNREKKPKIIKKSFFKHVNSCYAECKCHKNLIWVKVFKNEQIKFVEDNL